MSSCHHTVVIVVAVLYLVLYSVCLAYCSKSFRFSDYLCNKAPLSCSSGIRMNNVCVVYIVTCIKLAVTALAAKEVASDVISMWELSLFVLGNTSLALLKIRSTRLCLNREFFYKVLDLSSHIHGQ